MRLAQKKRKRYRNEKKWILDFNEYMTVSYTEKDIAVNLLKNHYLVNKQLELIGAIVYGILDSAMLGSHGDGMCQGYQRRGHAGSRGGQKQDHRGRYVLQSAPQSKNAK